MDAAGIVQLKNGKTAPAAPVATTMIALRRIAETDFIAFYELVCACRNPQHMVFGNTWQAAVGLALAEQVNGGRHPAHPRHRTGRHPQRRHWRGFQSERRRPRHLRPRCRGQHQRGGVSGEPLLPRQ